MAPSLAKGAIGAGQLIGSLLSGRNERPDYKIPDSVRMSLALAKARAANPYASGYTQQRDNLGIQSANLIRAAQQGGNATEAVASIQSGLNKGVRDLAQRGAQEQRQDEQLLTQELGRYGQYEDKEFQMNEFAPYAQKEQESRDVFGAGLENIMGSLDEFGVGSASGLFGGGGKSRSTADPMASLASKMGISPSMLKKLLMGMSSIKPR